jgi:enamine deaminase RidA (YjgF/YER057c/UK114 family)
LQRSEEQTRAVMENLRLVPAGLDLGFEHVVMARIYLTHRRCPDRSGARQRRQAAWICRNKCPRAAAEMFCCRHFPDVQSRVAADWY